MPCTQPIFLFFLHHVDESDKLCILPLMLLRGVVDVSVEGGLDLLRCLFKVVKNAEQQRVEEFLPNSSYHSPSSSSRAAAIQSCLHSAKMMLPCSAAGCTNPSWVDTHKRTKQHLQFEPKYLHSHEKHGEEAEACSLRHFATCSVLSSLTHYSSALSWVAAQRLDSGNYTNDSLG